MIKTWLLTIITVTMLAVGGCGPETTAAGLGLASGFATSETIKGMEADLAAREAYLIEQYNAEVEAEANAEILDRLKIEIQQTVRLRQGVQSAKDVLAIIAENKGSPGAQYGAIAAIIASLGLNLFQKRKGDVMKKTTRAIVKGIESAEKETKPNPTNKVKAAVKEHLVAAGIYNQGDDLIRQLKAAR